MKPLATAAALCLLALAACAPRAAAPEAKKESTVKYGIHVSSGPMDSVLLKDYAPASSLVVPETRVDKAKFPVIDVHTHASMSGIRSAADVDDWVKTMDETGIGMSVVFTEATGEKFDRIAAMFAKYPKRFQPYCGLDTSDIDAPDYPRAAGRRFCCRLDVLLRIGHKLRGGGRAELFLHIDAAQPLTLFVGHQSDHLAHGPESRTVEIHFVAGFDQRAAVERIVMSHGVFHFQARDFAPFADSRGPAFVAAVAQVLVFGPGLAESRRRPRAARRVGHRRAFDPVRRTHGGIQHF